MEQNNKQEQNKPCTIHGVSGNTLKKRIYAEHCPNCGTTAKFDTEKYCSERCKIEYRAMLERKFG